MIDFKRDDLFFYRPNESTVAHEQHLMIDNPEKSFFRAVGKLNFNSFFLLEKP